MNIGVSYHVVESVSFSGKRITMVKDGGHDLIYRSVLSRHFIRAEGVMLWLTISIWNCLLYSADMRDISGVARKSHLPCIDIVRYSNESWLDFHLPIHMFTGMGRSNRGGRDSIIADWETSANTFIPRVRIRCPKIMHIWDVSWPEPIVINAIHGEKQLTHQLPCCKMKRLVSIAWCSNEDELPQHDAFSSVLPYHCAISPRSLPRLDLLHAIRSANSCLTERKWVFEQKTRRLRFWQSRPSWIVLKSWTYNDVHKHDTAFTENTLTQMDIAT